ncbi:MAG TPA: hypothetical protein VMI10_21220 [Terriglobales bacterium]|nr:hypothetical protein [Terriglobales bacterium]
MRNFLLALCLTSSLAFAQQTSQGMSGDMHDMKGMDMPEHDMSKMAGEGEADESGAMHSMEGHHMDMGPHMKMTAMRAAQPGDAERAQKVVVAAREVMEKYKDYHTALNENFKIFHPELPQKQYHFTNYGNAFAAAWKFDAEKPTSLLYEKEGDGYRLVGVMYAAPKRYSDDDLDKRIPLSVAQWHEHVNFCSPPAGRGVEMLGKNPKFGLHGSIATQADCDAAGGTFHPIVFNWMVHVYPNEKDQAQVWSVERQHNHED